MKATTSVTLAGNVRVCGRVDVVKDVNKLMTRVYTFLLAGAKTSIKIPCATAARGAGSPGASEGRHPAKRPALGPS